MPQSGSVIGAYKIESESDIGKGGFGKVYRARSVRDGSVVALKLISLNNDDAVAAERTGARLQQRFKRTHGMVPDVFDFGDDTHYDCFYISMELVDAPTLSALLHRRPFAPGEAARHAIGICHFLEKAHSFETEIDGERFPRIVHGDLKPDNVFVLGDGTIKVLDFGIAKALEQTRAVKTLAFVTPPYASPERLETGHGSEQDDRWAVGVILYEMICGHRPYFRIEDARKDFVALSNAIRRNAPRESLPDSCPIAMAAIINKLLAFQSELRYSTAAAIRHDLEAFLRGERPEAMNQFDTPKTSSVPWPRDREPVLTLPLPPSLGSGVANGVAVIDPVVAPPRATRSAQTYVRRGVWLASFLALSALFTSESVVWLRAEQMRAALPSLELRTVAASRQQYGELQTWSPLALGRRVRLDRPLKDRLVTLADGVLADYRQEEPTVAEAQWRQAFDALEWARQLAPHDARLLPKALDCQGHLDRIAGQSQMRTNAVEARRLFARAIDEFQRAATLDRASADPYLGLSRIYIYGLRNIDLGAASIAEAERRGHPSGWPEHALLGDGYRLRADSAFNRARGVEGDAWRTMLESARDDYARCVESLAPILDKGQSRTNHRYCEQRIERLNRFLSAYDATQP